MNKKEKKNGLLSSLKKGKELWESHGEKITNVVKRGKELWDIHGEELTDAVKKAIPSKGKKIDVKSIAGVVSAGKSAWDDSGKEIVEDAVGLFSNDNSTDLPAEMLCDETVIETEDVETADEDTFFEDKLDTLYDTVKTTDPRNPQEVLAAISTLTQVSNETIQYVAEQETRREEIRAERDVAIARINAISDSIKLYLEKTFDERSAIFAKQFECVDAALRDGNTEMLAMTLNSINSLAASSPFKNLADIGQVQKALTAGDTEWDI